MDKKDYTTVLAVGAHPDDLEYGCGGTIAKWTSKGTKAYYLILTDGSKGSEDPKIPSVKLTKIRRAEQKQAAKILGVKKVFFLDFVDGELENTLEVRREIVKTIRLIQPDVVITMDPSMLFNQKLGFINHPDHRIAGQATIDAAFPFARNSRTFPELLNDGHKPHHVSEILLINFSKTNFYVDITEVLDRKLEALSKHKSQGGFSDQAKKRVKKMAGLYGKKAGLTYAEGFLRILINS